MSSEINEVDRFNDADGKDTGAEKMAITDKRWGVIENHDFRGLVCGQGSIPGSSCRNPAFNLAVAQGVNPSADLGVNPGVDLDLVLGGITTIANTGTKRIENGDMIYWTLPTRDDPFDRSIRGSSRMPLHTMFFDPKLDGLS